MKRSNLVQKEIQLAPGHGLDRNQSVHFPLHERAVLMNAAVIPHTAATLLELAAEPQVCSSSGDPSQPEEEEAEEVQEEEEEEEAFTAQQWSSLRLGPSGESWSFRTGESSKDPRPPT